MTRISHILSSSQFLEPAFVDEIIELARAYKAEPLRKKPLTGMRVATLFYEPSTRTRLSFESAAVALGADVVSTESAGVYSSAAKGETLEDTIRTVQGYVDAIVLRYYEKGGAERAAAVSGVPIINAGDGPGEHPTQALLDLFTIRELKQDVDSLKIGLVGDLKNGRTVHSLAGLLGSLHPAMRIVGVAPQSLQLQSGYAPHGLQRATYLEDVIGDLDIIYMTRIQKERFSSPEEYESLKDSFILDGNLMKRAKASAIVMHPLPRVGEIAAEVDDDTRAIYFQQAHNGLFVRMALLEHVLTH